MPRMSVRSVRTSLRLSAISGLPAFRRTGPSRWKIDAVWQSRVLRRDLVAGDLLGQEAVERLVAVQGVDHVVAEPPGVGNVAVVLVALGLGEADHVEPVLRPALAVARAGQQPVDEPLERVGRLVSLELLDLLGRRRQAGQVERYAAEPLAGLAAEAGDQFRSSSWARMNVSSDDCGQELSLTRAERVVTDRLEGPMPPRIALRIKLRRPSCRGSGAAISTHFTKSAMVWSGSLGFSGGISRSPSCRIACISRLLSGFLGRQPGRNLRRSADRTSYPAAGPL